MNLVGTWNQAIFTPDWVSRKLVDSRASGQMRMGFLPGGVFTRFDVEGAALTILPGQLQVAPQLDEEQAWLACEGLARKILETLPETPLQAFGINIGLDLDDTASVQAVTALPDVQALSNFGASLELSALVRRVRLDGRVVNLTLSREGDAIRLDVNHHFDVGAGNAGSASSALLGAVVRARRVSLNLATVAYGAKGGHGA